MNLQFVKAADRRILDFDMETLAAGYADPQWVPSKITAVAWSWVGEDEIHSLVTGKRAFWDRKLRGRKLKPFLDALAKADVVTGHNVLRFDLLILNAECHRAGLPPLRPVDVIDTIRLSKTKGLKKGQDNLAHGLGLEEEKMQLIWSEWDDAYEEAGWKTVADRCRSDVAQHKELLAALGEWRKPIRKWSP